MTAEFFSAGGALDLALAVVLAELAGLVGYRLLRARHLVAVDVYANLLAAAGLLCAARATLAAMWWGYTAAGLLLALLAHGVALKLRWRSRPDTWAGRLSRVV